MKRETKPGAFARLSSGLLKSSQRISQSLSLALAGKTPDKDSLEAIEDALILADLGPKTAHHLCDVLAGRKFAASDDPLQIHLALADEIARILQVCEQSWSGEPGQIVIFVGVNGSGKTTSIGKLAARLRSQGQGVTLGACDTFRAAATEQLGVWAERTGAHLVSSKPQADAGGLAFEAVQTGLQRQDCVLIDTAGRLQNRSELMDELARIVRAVRKAAPNTEPDIFLVLDAGTGQNALAQAEGFRHAAGVSGLILTRLDGTAKGGVLVALAQRTRLPVHFIGTGEQIEDLQPFEAKAFAAALLDVPLERLSV